MFSKSSVYFILSALDLSSLELQAGEETQAHVFPLALLGRDKRVNQFLHARIYSSNHIYFINITYMFLSFQWNRSLYNIHLPSAY